MNKLNRPDIYTTGCRTATQIRVAGIHLPRDDQFLRVSTESWDMPHQTRNANLIMVIGIAMLAISVKDSVFFERVRSVEPAMLLALKLISLHRPLRGHSSGIIANSKLA